MASQGGALRCAQCRWVNAPGARYCANCGEPVDPRLIAELHRAYVVLTELDAQVAAGGGGKTVESLRDAVRDHYLAQRQPQRPAAQPTAAPSSMPPAGSTPAAAPLSQPAIAPAYPTAIAPQAAAPQPHGPVFTWRAFIAEQAIAVMAYLGGFLLLIATLTFEVGGWQALPDVAKLGGVLLVYLIFGLLGMTLRRAASLRTVSRVYLGVFALMTPLAALAVYRFELQARGFPVAGMVCLAAAYAAVVYLALATRTRFVTYAYLGWTALLVAALAIPIWAQASSFWELPIANVVALLLLAPRAVSRRRGGARAWLESIEPSATQISAGIMIVAGLLTIMLTLQTATARFSGATPDSEELAAMAVAACALAPLFAGWSWAARTFSINADRETVATLDWLTAASVALAASAVVTWLHVTPATYSYTISATALFEGLVAEGVLRLRAPQHVGLRVAVQALAATLAALGALLGVGVAVTTRFTPGHTTSLPHDYVPVVIACVVGLALALLFALRGSLAGVVPWGLLGGAFLILGAQEAFNMAISHALLYTGLDRMPGALAEISTLFAYLALALVAVALCLHATPEGSRMRRLRAPAEITALAAALVSALYLQLLSHTQDYSALLLGVFALAALVVARVERSPLAAGSFVGFFGSLASFVYLNGNVDGAAVAATPVALALATLALRRLLGHAYSVPVYITTLLATAVAFIQLQQDPFETTAQLSFLSLGVASWMALVVALALTIDTMLTRTPLMWVWMAAPATVTLLSLSDAHTLWARMTLTLALAGVGALLQRMRGQHTESAWHIAALVGSAVTLVSAAFNPQHPAEYTLGLALLFALVVYAVAWQERQPWLTVIIMPYALVSLVEVGTLPISPTRQMVATLAIALAFTVAGMLARWRLGRSWALALYSAAVVGAGFTAARVSPYPERAGLLEAILLVFAALAFFAALLEETPWAALAPAAFAAVAALVQPDGRALLPLALAFAAGAFAVSRTRGAAWSLPLYGATMVAAVAAAWQGRAQGGAFEVVALVTLALAAWLLAALESRADALLVAFVFAALAVSAAARAFTWDAWAATLAFAALAWIFELSRLGWARIPWLRERDGAWLPSLGRTAEAQAAWRDPRRAGQRIARGAAALVAGGVVVGGMFAPRAFTTQSTQTQALAVALLSLAALLARFGWGASGWRPALYLAGEALALCVTWELRWLGAQNLQAWIITPGSAQLIIGALLPADTRLRPPAWVAQAFSVAGAFILMLPTLSQSVTEPLDWQWRYTLLLAVEALALTLLATGLRNRILALTGSAFVGVAAIRGAIIAVQQNLPVPIVIGVFALALMGLATWLSLRARRASHTPTSQ